MVVERLEGSFQYTKWVLILRIPYGCMSERICLDVRAEVRNDFPEVPQRDGPDFTPVLMEYESWLAVGHHNGTEVGARYAVPLRVLRKVNDRDNRT